MTVYFLIPVYNESQNIELLAANLKSAVSKESKHYIFVDDSSTDNTIEMIHACFKDTDYDLIKKEENRGPGDSFSIGFNKALGLSADESDIVVTLEADNTSDLGILNNMITISRMGYDLVLSSIYAQGGGFYKTSAFRKLISFFANMFFRAVYNIKVLTLSSFYRVYHVSLLRKVAQRWPAIVDEKGFICMLEILIKAIKSQANIIEVPMTLRSENRVGKSKMKILKTSVSYLRFLLFKRI